MGERFQLHLTLVSGTSARQRLAVDYAVHHVKADGRRSPKVFKGWVLELPGRERRDLVKSHSMRPVTTRRYHPGRHLVELRVNGRSLAQAEFELMPPGA